MKGDSQAEGGESHLAMALLAGVRGLEPRLAVLETAVLPLNDTPAKELTIKLKLYIIKFSFFVKGFEIIYFDGRNALL